jgi:hypothetical protein
MAHYTWIEQVLTITASVRLLLSRIRSPHSDALGPEGTVSPARRAQRPIESDWMWRADGFLTSANHHTSSWEPWIRQVVVVTAWANRSS